MLEPFMLAGVIEAGCDEAGRGCLAGPVACAAVILPEGFRCEGIDDSKKLTARRRSELRGVIERSALAWKVVMIDAGEIDRINILRASIHGMQQAVCGLEIRPEHLIVDGNRFSPFENPIPYHTVVKGDGKFMSIAAASILAKTHRDEFMERMSAEYPGYGWERNKGYPTKEHREAILRLGLTPLHRRSFAPCLQLSLFD